MQSPLASGFTYLDLAKWSMESFRMHYKSLSTTIKICSVLARFSPFFGDHALLRALISVVSS